MQDFPLILAPYCAAPPIGIIIGYIIGIIISKFIRKESKEAEERGVYNSLGEYSLLDENNFTIRAPDKILFIYIFLTFIMVIFGGALISENGASFGNSNVFFILPLMLLGPLLIISWVRRKVKISGDQITYTSSFGKSKSFSFDYITSAKYLYGASNRAKTLAVYHEKKKLFVVQDTHVGYHTFISRLKNENIKFDENEGIHWL